MARLLVSDGTVAKQAGKYQIVVNGVVKPILRALAVHDGVCRQYWPTVEPDADPRITWTTSALTVTQSVQDPADSISTINFNRSLGLFTYNDYPNADGFGSYLQPPLDGTAGDDAKYFIKVDQLTGTALTGTLGSWIDLNSATDFVWSLDETVVGTLGATANISIKNAAGTTVVKVVTFVSTVVANSNIVWPTEQAGLVEIKESVDADCVLTFNPAGWASGDADTSGSFTDAWHVNSPNLDQTTLVDRSFTLIVDSDEVLIEPRASTSGDYSVKATLISGTAPTGSALATALSLDEVRQWTLLATTGEDLSCALDVEVDTIPTSTPVVRRITMNSVRNDSTPPVWTTDEWTLTDVAFKQANSLEVDVTITFPAAADATGAIVNLSGGGTQETDAWLPVGDAAADYEVRVLDGFGANILLSHDFGTWYPLTSGQVFLLQYITITTLKHHTITVSVRKIGSLSVDKIVNIDIAGDDGSIPP